MLLSGGGRTLDVPGSNQKIEVVLPIERKDLSGQSSSSSFSSAGDKAQRICVATQISMADKEDLRKLAQLARARDAIGEPIVYDIDDELCNAHDIRQVVFSGDFRSSEADGVRAWLVTFGLQEYLSVAELQEERARTATTEAEPPEDGETAIGTTDPARVNRIIRESRESIEK